MQHTSIKIENEHITSTTNQATIDSYNHNAKSYIQNTPQSYQEYQKKMILWIHTLMDILPTNSSVFEIGSATARDARYFRERGYIFQCSDAAEGFIQVLRRQGEAPLHFNALTDTINGTFDAFFANGVFPHFTPNEVRLVLAKLYSSLPSGGLLAFNVKKGQGEIWVHEKFEEGRFTHYWHLDDLLSVLETIGFKVLFAKDNCPGDLPNHIWINLIVQKL